MRVIATHTTTVLGDFRRYPGCRLYLTCGLCGWSKNYSVERVINRLRELKSGGHTTPLDTIPRRIGWNCPRCGRRGWRAQFAWPPGLDAGEARRLANQYRN